MSVNSKNIIGLFFGSFNPVHIGHLIIANYFVQFSDVNKICFVVSPQNPFKLNENMLDAKLRLELVKLAIRDNPAFEVTDIEFSMEQPSYTYATLQALISKNPENKYVLLIGSDNIEEFDKWKNYKKILDMAEVYVYPRIGYTSKTRFCQHPKVALWQAPIMEISSSLIRKHITDKKDPKYLLPDIVYKHIMENNYYKK